MSTILSIFHYKHSYSGYRRSDVRTPYTGPSIGGSSFSKSLNRSAPLYNVPKHQIQRRQRDDCSLSKRAKKYSLIKEKLLTIVLMNSRRISKSIRVPNGVAEYACQYNLYESKNVTVE